MIPSPVDQACRETHIYMLIFIGRSPNSLKQLISWISTFTAQKVTARHTQGGAIDAMSWGFVRTTTSAAALSSSNVISSVDDNTAVSTL